MVNLYVFSYSYKVQKKKIPGTKLIGTCVFNFGVS